MRRSEPRLASGDKMDTCAAQRRQTGCGGAVQRAQAVLLVNAGAGAWDQAHRTSSVSLKFVGSIRMPAAKRAIP